MFGWPGDGGNDTVVCEGTSGENPPRGGAEQPVEEGGRGGLEGLG